MLTAPLGPSSSIDPALIAAGLGTGALGSQAAMSAGEAGVPAAGFLNVAVPCVNLSENDPYFVICRDHTGHWGSTGSDPGS